MTALNKDRTTPQRAADLVADPLAAGVVIFAGSMYVLDGLGNATPATADAAKPVRAVARKRSVQAEGDEQCDGAIGCFRFDNSEGGTAITRVHIGANAFAIDDQTVANAGTCIAGVILDVDEQGVWVRIGTRVPVEAGLAP
ncbi:hypothetical protein G7047_19050 [Diaphorobacter sp. HDW4A]|uniref:hypothetical protein n=1 Tax=Diaphorobacter sp. HDW4A TaxID=2714924 RepID=UPI00140C0F87|nr:hypothetical protein [Diaphorobacter sp. HDW4A]QIL81778.1 hypothetical protein G7047_19050 [Diaphorobacter sp. HDW4A]